MKIRAMTAIAVATLTVGACDRPSEQATPEPSPTPTPTASPASVLRDDLPELVEEAPREPFEAVVPFGEGGTKLGEKALAVIEEIVAAENFSDGGAITLRGHTDSAGHDEANLRASEDRAQAVADALVEAGANEQRIKIIALGETRPVAPNANLDGTVNEAGRARNRRVDVTIAPPAGPKPDGTGVDAGPTPQTSGGSGEN